MRPARRGARGGGAVAVTEQDALRALLTADGPVVVTEAGNFKEAVATAYAHLGEGGERTIRRAASGSTAYVWFPGDGLSVLWVEDGDAKADALAVVDAAVAEMPHDSAAVGCGDLLEEALGWNAAVEPWGGRA